MEPFNFWVQKAFEGVEGHVIYLLIRKTMGADKMLDELEGEEKLAKSSR